jgi:hypothetical protein
MNRKTVNLGQIQAVSVGASAPTNTNLIWYDTNTGLQKFYDGSNWVPIGNRGQLKDDGTFTVVTGGHLTFNNSGSVPTISDVFIIKAPSTIAATVYIAINGETELELIDTKGNNISSLTSGVSYMIMKIDDVRDISSSESYSESQINDVYVLVGQVSTDRRKIENTISVDVDEFTSVRLHKYFTIPRLYDNLSFKTKITTDINTASSNKIKIALHIFSEIIGQVQIDRFPVFTEIIQNASGLWNGNNRKDDEFICTYHPVRFKNKDYTYVWLNPSDVTRGDSGAFDFTIEFRYPSKEQ